MNELSIEERRRRLLAATADSRLTRECPTLVRSGLDIIHNRWDQVARLCAARPGRPATEAVACLGIVAMIKPVGDDCNLRCRYCDTRSITPVGLHMGLDLLERIIAEVLPGSPPSVDFIFHGGEPLLAGIEFFRAAMALQKKHARCGQVVRNHVQTNGTLISEEWARFLAEHGVFVGVSLDGPEAAHDSHRIGPEGSGSHARVMQGIDRLQRADARVQAIAVVAPTPRIPATNLLAFMQSTGIPTWRVNFCRSIAAIATYPDYINELFRDWMATPDACDISILSETIEGLLGYPLRSCWMNGSCRHFIGFDPDGSVSPCCQMPVAPEYVYGNLREQPLKALLTGPVAQRFHKAFLQGAQACTDCAWRHLCGGGCSFSRIQDAGSPAGPDPLCHLYQGLFSRLTRSFDAALSLPNSPAT